MTRKTLSVLLVMLLIGAVGAQAQPKNVSVGAGLYGIGFAFDHPTVDLDNETFTGYNFTGTFLLGPSSAIRGDLYFTTYDEDADKSSYELQLNGYDAQFLFGSNLDKLGFKFYGLIGYWSEKMETEEVSKSDDDDERMSGLMAGLGLGNNWEGLTFDIWAAWRQPKDYQDALDAMDGNEIDVSSVAVALTLGIRF